jgi:hypothetical protein
MDFGLPEIAPEECTPLVQRLLEVIRHQQQLLQQLRDEVARLKGLSPRPPLAPSRLEQPPPPSPPGPGHKRPGSAKRPKNALLVIHEEVTLAVPDPPPGSAAKGYEDYVVQELVLRAHVTRYRRQRLVAPDGRTLLAPLPADVLPGSHYGPHLHAFVLHQYHHNHVTQPLLLEQLRQWGFDLSAGQLSRLLTEVPPAFHREKEGLLPAGRAGAAYVQVDDTGARHGGRNGSCTHIGNELFAYFASTDSKSRQNFLEVFRRPHTDYVINDTALAYWQRQELSAAVVAKLCHGPRRCADAAGWEARLRALGIAAERHVRLATEGALLGSLIDHGVSPALVVLSDGAPQYAVLAHAACWVHEDRKLARLVPISDKHRGAIDWARELIGEFYRDLKGYRQRPDPTLITALEARFDFFGELTTGFISVDGVLRAMHARKADLLRVLYRPAVPLHNNTSEAHLRDYVKKRKISGSTRSEAGRRCRDTFASLKKTCRCLGVRFWDYLLDRVRGVGQVAWLPDLVRQRTRELAAGQGAAVLT